MTPTTPRTRKSFLYNIVLPSALAVLLFMATLFFIVIPSFENAMMDRKREMIRELTNAATSILDKYHRDEAEGLLSREDAQKTAISRIRYLRYGDENKDYFWVTDTIPIMVMHPYRPELNGQNLSTYQDPHGKKLFVESVQIAREQGHGYVDYMWQWKDDSSHIVPKLSYVRAFKPWGWIVGTGIYIEDVKKEIASLTASFLRISLIISFVVALILFWVGRQSFRIENKRLKAEEELRESREKYRSLVEASTEGLLMVMEGRSIFTNPVMQAMTGIPEEHLLEIVPEEITEEHGALLPMLGIKEKDPVPSPVETMLKRGDGTTLPVLVNASPVVFNNRNAVILSFRDLSAAGSPAGQQGLEHSRFMTLMDTLGIGVFRATMDTRGRFTDANRAALQILGYKELDELAGQYILEMFTELDDKKGFRNQLLRDGFLKNQILKLRRKNGQPAVVSISLVIAPDSRTELLCDGIMEDITFQRKDSTFSDSLANDYNRFSQLFLQPVKNLMQPALQVGYKETLEEVAQNMTTGGQRAALVMSEEGEPLGFVSDSDIRSRALAGRIPLQTPVFQIMTSPVVSVSQDALVMEALALFRTRKVAQLMVFDNFRKLTGIFGQRQLMEILEAFPALASLALEGAPTIQAMAAYRQKFIQSLLPLIETTRHPVPVYSSLAILSDTITRAIIERVLSELGPAPAEFCFFSLGSDARREQTLSTDQDNALIFRDVDEQNLPGALAWFNQFSTRVCTALDEVGYTFCKGNIMAMNPQWCQPVSAWKSCFNRWINKAGAKDLLDINIFFDIRPVSGDQSLISELQTYIFGLTQANPAYLFHLAQNTLMLKPQVGFWGNILLETAGAPPETVNIKEAIMPVVNFARIYALKNSIEAAGTLQRLDILLERNVLLESSYTNTVQAFEHLNLMRLKHQAYLLRKDLKPDNLINTKTLSDLDKVIIKKVIAGIGTLLSKLSYDFKGSM